MKTLSIVRMALLAICFSACQKEVKQPAAPETSTAPHLVNYSSLPSGGKYVNVPFENGKSIYLYQVDTQYILEGDMVLNPSQVELLKQLNGKNARTFITGITKFWGSGNVAYTFNANLTTASRNTILAAMADWHNSVAGITFVARTTHVNYIEFNASTQNNSNVGMTGGKQVINLIQDATWGVDLTSATHEIGHSLGMYHEQSRSDRNSFISVNISNIKPGALHNFQTYSERGLPGTQIGSFDFNSIMLYPSVITDATMVYNTSIATMTVVNSTSTWGWNWWLSAGDVATGAYIYGPPFGRIRKVVVYEDYQFGAEQGTNDIYLDFFSDPQCTQPVNLNVSRPVNIVEHVSQYGVYTGSWWYENNYVFNLTAGTQSFYIGQENWHLYYDGSGTTTDEHRNEFVLVEPFKRW